MSYDPTIGRWTTEDPIAFEGGDANLYRYVGNSPTNATDPTGLFQLPDARLGRKLTDDEKKYLKDLKNSIQNALNDLKGNPELAQILKDYNIKDINKLLYNYNIADNLLDEIDSKDVKGLTRPIKGQPGKYITYFANDCFGRKLEDFLVTYFHELYHQTGWSHADGPPNKADDFGKKMGSLIGKTKQIKEFINR